MPSLRSKAQQYGMDLQLNFIFDIAYTNWFLNLCILQEKLHVHSFFHPDLLQSADTRALFINSSTILLHVLGYKNNPTIKAVRDNNL